MFLNTLLSIGVLYTGLTNILVLTGLENIPCFFTVPFTPIILLLFFVPVSIRTILFYYRIQRFKIISEKEIFQKTFDRYKKRGGEGIEEEDLDRLLMNSKQSTFSLTMDLFPKLCPWFFKPKTSNSNLVTSVISNSHRGSEAQTIDSTAVGDMQAILSSEYTRVKFFGSYRFGILLFMIGAIIFITIGVILLVQNEVFACSGCDIYETKSTGIIIMPVLVVEMYYLYKVKGEPDPLWIRRELIILFVMNVLGVCVVLFLSNSDPGSIEESGVFRWNTLYQYIIFANFIIIIPLQVWYDTRGEKVDYVEINKDFNRLLKSEIGISYFKTHLTQEMSLENLLFYQEARTWKAQYRKHSLSRRVIHLRRIYETYLKPYSRLEINILHTDLLRIEEALKAKKFKVTVLDAAIKEVRKLMAADSFPRFKTSQLYEDYRQGLIEHEGTVQGVTI